MNFSEQPRRTSASYRRFLQTARAWWCRNDLSQLATLFGTDKWGAHWYTQHYQRYFYPLKKKRLNILEIGVGGYENSGQGGESLRMWKTYFRNSQIIGIDIHDKSRFREKRIDIHQCDQTSKEALSQLANKYGGFDIIIDDGSHINDHVIKTFHILFPLLRPGGIYAVEDIQTSYWPMWGGGIGDAKSSMTFFKGLADGLNYVEYPVEGYKANYFDENIVEIAFFHNLILIRKGSNDEKANLPALIHREVVIARRSASGIA
jgi:hypothetical protein